MKTLKAETAARIQFGLARKGDFDRMSEDDVRAIKSDKDVTHFRFVERGAKADESDEEQRTVVHIASSEHVDSMGDIIRVSGWDLVRMKVGRIPLIGGHDAGPVPFGLVLSGNKRAKCDDGVKALETKSRFHEQELYQDSEYGKHVEAMRTLVVRGDLPGCSVGFMPKAYHWPDDEERDANGMPRYGMVFDEQELLELSITPIPANSRAQMKKSMEQVRAALRELVAAGTVDAAVADQIAARCVASDEAFLQRAKDLSVTRIVLANDLPWLKRVDALPDVQHQGPVSEPTPDTKADEVEVAIAAIQKAAGEAVDRIREQARAAIRQEAFAALREILEPAEAGIEEAAERIELAVKALGRSAQDSDRAEVSGERAPNGAAATSAESTGTSRDNPTNHSSLGDALVRALEAGAARTDTAHADAGTDQGDQGPG